MEKDETLTPWFKQGLKFKCTGCGKCCTGAPGYVWLDENEIQNIATFLNVSLEAFMHRYVRKVFGRYSLIEDERNYDCVFLKNNQCQIYPVRPTQCKTFPWWQGVLESSKSWEETQEMCEGINHPDAPIITLDTILSQLELNH